MTVPKLTETGLTLNCGCAANTVPLKATGVDVAPSELPSVIVPFAVPAVVPLNQTRKLTLCPGDRIVARFKLEEENSPFEKLTCEIVMLAVPVFFKIALCDVLPPSATLPKLRLEGVTLNAEFCVPPPGVEFAVTTPEQPLKPQSESVPRIGRRTASFERTEVL